MKLGLDARGGVDDELLAFGAQLGATDVIGGGLPEDAATGSTSTCCGCGRGSSPQG